MQRWLSEDLINSATHKMNYLHAVTFGERDLGPATSRSDFPVQFHGDAVSLESEVLDECGKRSSTRKVFGLAVHNNGHGKQCKGGTIRRSNNGKL